MALRTLWGDGRRARHATLCAAHKVGARHPARVLARVAIRGTSRIGGVGLERTCHIGMCRVRDCAGTTYRHRSTSRTIALPGTPRVARSGTALPVRKEAAARSSSVVADLPASSARPRCSCDAGTPGRHRRPGVPEGRGWGATVITGNRDERTKSDARIRPARRPPPQSVDDSGCSR